MVAISSTFAILVSLSTAAFAARSFEGAARARHEKRAHSIQSRSASFTLVHNHTGEDFLDTRSVHFDCTPPIVRIKKS
jgi:hypothetical protein